MAKCAKCSKNVTKKSPGIQCNKCNKWLHGTCAAITNEQLSALSTTESVDWKCKVCTGNLRPKRLSCIVPDAEEDENTDADTETITTNTIVENISRDLRREVREIIRQELQTTLQFYSDKIDDYEKKKKSFETTTKLLENSCMEIKHKYINFELKYQAMEQKINAMEQNQLANSLEICGVEETENEDILQIASDFATKIKCNPEDIIEAHRKPTHPRRTQDQAAASYCPIIRIQLRSGRRALWFEAAKSTTKRTQDLEKNTTEDSGELAMARKPKIYLREPLTPYNSYLLWRSKTELKNTNLCKYVWPKDGQILAKKMEKGKTFNIRTVADLEKLKNQLRNGQTNGSHSQYD